MSYDWKKELPEEYILVLEKFGYPDNIKELSPSNLIFIWREAIKALKKTQDADGYAWASIATETRSISSAASLVDTDPDADEILEYFGDMELSGEGPPVIPMHGVFLASDLEQAIEALATKHSIR